MKSLLLISSLIISSISFGQTAVIFNKSHSGNSTLVLQETDNFGGPEIKFPPPNLISLPANFFSMEIINLIDEHCFTHHYIGSDSSVMVIDTLCNDIYFEKNGYTIESAKAKYGESIRIIGFPTQKTKQNTPNDSSNFWINGSPFQSGMTGFFGLIILSYLFYLIVPIFKKN